MNLKTRSYQQELLDAENIPAKDLKKNLEELNFINNWLGGHRITINGFKQLVQSHKEITICEIGCGGGDNIFALSKWCLSRGIKANFIGIDIKPECIAFAKEKHSEDNFSWIISDYKKARFTIKPGIIFSSLFCHHFTEDQLIFQLQWMKENSTTGFFINDLHRHQLAYQSIKLLTSLFSKSYLVKHDAPLSVSRGFTQYEWEAMLKTAGIIHYKIIWKWAFRHLVIYQHE